MIDISRAEAKLKRILKQADNLPWNKAGDIVLKSIDQGFEKGGQYKKQGSFEGGNRRWVKRKKFAKHPILQKSRRMRRRIRKIVRANSVQIKSTMPYSATHQFGDQSRNISARPHIVMPPPNNKEIQKLFIAHLSNV